MKHKVCTVKFLAAAFIFLSVFTLSTESSAQFLEVFAVVQQMNGDKTTSSDMTLDVDDSIVGGIVGGIGAGFNIGKVNLNMDLLFGAADITSINSKLDAKLFCADMNLDYNILKGSITPLITAGIGSITFSDSNIKVEEFTETDFSYNFGAGLRWTIKEHYLIKGMYRATWTKIKDTDDSIMFNGISIFLGYIL